MCFIYLWFLIIRIFTISIYHSHIVFSVVFILNSCISSYFVSEFSVCTDRSKYKRKFSYFNLFLNL